MSSPLLHHQQRQKLYGDLLLKSVDSPLASPFSHYVMGAFGAPAISSIPGTIPPSPALYSASLLNSLSNPLFAAHVAQAQAAGLNGASPTKTAPLHPLLGGPLPVASGTFQHLLASMSMSAAARKDDVTDGVKTPISREQSPAPTSRIASPHSPTMTSPESQSSEGADQRKSSSIAALRMRARQYEMCLPTAPQNNAIPT